MVDLSSSLCKDLPEGFDGLTIHIFLQSSAENITQELEVFLAQPFQVTGSASWSVPRAYSTSPEKW